MPHTDRTASAAVIQRDRSSIKKDKTAKKARKAKKAKEDKGRKRNKKQTAEGPSEKSLLEHLELTAAPTPSQGSTDSNLIPRSTTSDPSQLRRSVARMPFQQRYELMDEGDGTGQRQGVGLLQMPLLPGTPPRTGFTRDPSPGTDIEGDVGTFVEVRDVELNATVAPKLAAATIQTDNDARDSTVQLFEPPTFDETAVTAMHEKTLLAQRPLRSRPASSRISKSNSRLKVSTKSKTIAQSWGDDLRRLAMRDPTFFSSDEASLRLQGKAIAGKPAYSAIPINENNNYDMRKIYNSEYEPKISSGGGQGTFKQLTVVAGQFMRLSIVRGVTLPANVYKTGQLFEAICDQTTIDLLIDHYRARAICTTVMTKAMNLKKIADHAKLHFAGNSETFAALAEKSRMHLRIIFNVQKALGRARASSLRSLEPRIASAAIFMPQDFYNCKPRVGRELDGIMHAYMEDEQEHGRGAAETRLFDKTLIKKWCINFLVLLVLVGGGQRSQVYTQVQVPKEDEVEDIRQSCGRRGFIELRTVKEKTCRSRDLPFVLIPGSARKYVEFHISHVRKGILVNASYDESECLSYPLLLHSETAQALLSSQVTRTFKQFLEKFEPELASVTLMNLRSSYGTMMMKAYNDKQVFTDLNEGEFLDQLARQMNTSSEQLRATYISIDRSDYERSARGLVTALETVTAGREEEDGDELDAECEGPIRRGVDDDPEDVHLIRTDAQRICSFLA